MRQCLGDYGGSSSLDSTFFHSPVHALWPDNYMEKVWSPIWSLCLLSVQITSSMVKGEKKKKRIAEQNSSILGKQTYTHTPKHGHSHHLHTFPGLHVKITHHKDSMHTTIAPGQIAPQCWGKGEENKNVCHTKTHLKRYELSNIKSSGGKGTHWQFEGDS